MILSFFFKDFIYLFLERGQAGEREGEKQQCVVASHMPSTGDLACNPGVCLDWESTSNSGSQALTQSTEPHLQKEVFFESMTYPYFAMYIARFFAQMF